MMRHPIQTVLVLLPASHNLRLVPVLIRRRGQGTVYYHTGPASMDRLLKVIGGFVNAHRCSLQQNSWGYEHTLTYPTGVR